MIDLRELRVQLTKEQRDIVNTIWRYEREKNQGIPAITLYDQFGSETTVRNALQPLGGDVAYIPPFQDSKQRYHLTFLGHLLAERGEELENLLARYLKFVRKQLKADSECYGVNIEAAMESCGFTAEEKIFFKEIFYRTPFHGAGGGGGAYETGLPSGINEWFFAIDMGDFVRQRAMRSYDPATSIDGGHLFGSYNANLIGNKVDTTSSLPPEITDSLGKFREDHPDAGNVGFIMMRFGQTQAHDDIVQGIHVAFDAAGLTAVRADDKQYHDDLLANILTYVYGCGFGIAVFERLEEDNFNPNVSLEVGYMMGLRKPVCLLKDKTLKTLHADLVGRLYRSFDPQDPIRSLPVSYPDG
jgi:hypothetical protein